MKVKAVVVRRAAVFVNGSVPGGHHIASFEGDAALAALVVAARAACRVKKEERR